jgi:hypothetical protein
VNRILAIRDTAVDGSSDLATLLRNCRILASEIKNQALAEWAKSELDGYSETAELPEYRILRNMVHLGNFVGIAGSGINNFPLEISRLPEQVREHFSVRELRQGVQELKQLIGSYTDKFIQLSWEPEIYGVFDHSGFRPDLRLVQAWSVVPVARLEGTLDAIRNKVLTFVLELEALGIGADDEGKIGTIDTPTNDRITQIFNQTIYGSVSNVGHAGNVSTVSHVVLGNLQSLNTALQAAGVEENEIRDLNAALESDRQAGAATGGRFGRHVSNWLGEMVKKSAQGAIKIGTDVITGVITEQIKQYTGQV